MSNIQVKRTITVKVIVTEQFKNYLVEELTNAIRNLDNQLVQLESQGSKLVDSLKLAGDKAQKQMDQVKQQMELDKQQQKLAKEDLLKKIKEAKLLALNTEFNQGTLDSWVEIQKGDNLYEKLGATEIIVKDGVIQDIRQLKA
jgi:Ni,Fe-hydrogenase I large subunit